MKIVIVTGHFMPEIGYQEVYLARSLSRLGHSVTVVTSTVISPTGKKVLKSNYKEGKSIDDKYGFTVIRLKPIISIGAKNICFGINSLIKKEKPDLIISLAVAKLFPLPIFRMSKKFKIISLFGDADEYIRELNKKNSLRSFYYNLLFSIIKRYTYNIAIKGSERVILNIPESENYLRRLLKKNNFTHFEKKKLNLYLGFDPDEFYYDELERAELRKKLEIKEDQILITTSTRVNKKKNLEQVIDVVDQLVNEGIKAKYLIIGLHEDDYGNELKKYIQSKKNNSNFICLPFQDHDTIRKYFNASDIGIWLKVAISIQEAMGTGLPILLQERDSVNHLIQDGKNGWFYSNGGFKNKLEEILRNCDISTEKRKITSDSNRKKFSYDLIAQKIINSLTNTFVN